MKVPNFHALLKKKCSLAFGTALTMLQLCATYSPLTAIQPDSFFDVGGGARFDRFTDLTKTYGIIPLEYFANDCHCIPCGTLCDDVFLHKDKIKAKRLDLYVIQANAQLRFCDYWFARAFASYGWLTHGKYHEDHRDRFLNGFDSESHIKDGRARDYSIGFGYLYPVDSWWGCWGCGPVVGWAYNDLRMDMGSFTTDGFDNPSLRNLNYTSRWSGPWLGVDLVYEPHCYPFKLTSSFEFHWVTWHGSRRLNHHDIKFVEFSDRRKSDDAHGMVFNADGQWNFACGLHASLAVKIQFFDSSGGRMKPLHGNFKQQGFPYIDDIKDKHARWYSDTYTFNIGADF